MFDLFRRKNTLVKYLLGAILMAVAVAMVVTLIPSSFLNSPLTTGNAILAEIDGQPIYASEAQTLFQNNARGQLPPDMMEVYFPQFVDQMIMQRAAVYQAQRMGLTVSDEEILVGLQASSLGQFFQNGKVISMDQFEVALAQQGLTPQMVIDDMRNSLLLRKLQNVMLESTVVTPQEIEQAFRDKYERASVEYISFTSADFRNEIEVTEDEVRQRFENEKALYNEPERYSFRVAVLDQYQLESKMQLTEAELRAAYASSMDNFRQPEQVHARHILLSTEGKSASEKEALHAKAEDLIQQLKDGADFAALAAANSDDGGNANTGGDLGFFTRGTMVPEFDEAAFSLPVNQISDVVETQYGYHILEVTERQDSTVQPFEQVRGNLESQLRAEKISEQMDSVSEQLRRELTANPGDAAAIAERLGATLVTVTDNAAGDPIPTLGVSPEIDSALVGLQPGGVTRVLSLPADRLVVAILDSKTAPRPSTFEEAEAQVRDKLLNERTETIAQEKATEAAERLRNGEDIGAVARSMGLTATTSNDFARADNIDGLGPAAYLEDAFTSDPGTILGPTLVQGMQVVAVVTGRTEADMSLLDSERSDIQLKLKEEKALDRNNLFLDSVLTKLTNDGKITVYHDEIQRTMALYRQ